MNDEIRPKNYSPDESGNPLPDLGKHGAFNEPPIAINRPRTEPSRAMSAEPMKYLLPAGPELRDVIRRRLEAKQMSTPALWASLNQSYQTRPRQEQALIDAVAGMLTDGELEQRDGKLHVAEPEPPVAEKPESIDPAMWTMTQTERLLSVLTDEPRTRAWLAEATGLKPKQVSKAMNYLIGQGRAEVAGDVPRTWRRKDTMSEAEPTKQPTKHEDPKKMDAGDGCPATRPEDTEPETAVLTEQQTRDVALERASSACPEGVLVEDVARLSGWNPIILAHLLETMLRDGELIRLDDMRISRPLVKSEDPPEYEIGDEDDGEIPEPGIARPAGQYVPESVTVAFVLRDGGGYIAAEHHITIDEHGLCFDGTALSFNAVDAVMPVLRRVHRAAFGDGD